MFRDVPLRRIFVYTGVQEGRRTASFAPLRPIFMSFKRIGFRPNRHFTKNSSLFGMFNFPNTVFVFAAHALALHNIISVVTNLHPPPEETPFLMEEGMCALRAVISIISLDHLLFRDKAIVESIAASTSCFQPLNFTETLELSQCAKRLVAASWFYFAIKQLLTVYSCISSSPDTDEGKLITTYCKMYFFSFECSNSIVKLAVCVIWSLRNILTFAYTLIIHVYVVICICLVWKLRCLNEKLKSAARLDCRQQSCLLELLEKYSEIVSAVQKVDSSYCDAIFFWFIDILISLQYHVLITLKPSPFLIISQGHHLVHLVVYMFLFCEIVIATSQTNCKLHEELLSVHKMASMTNFQELHPAVEILNYMWCVSDTSVGLSCWRLFFVNWQFLTITCVGLLLVTTLLLP